MTLSGKHIFVTGAGAGIGLGIARQCREAGADVTGIDIHTAGEPKLQEIGARFAQVDVADLDAFEAAINESYKHFGRLDGLVNNVGVTIEVPFFDMTKEQMETLWTVNQRSTLFGAQIAGRIMADAGSGSIVNIASNHADATNSGHEGYSGTKGAIVSMTRAMAWSLGTHGIRVNSLCPGLTQTETVLEAMKDPNNTEKFRSWTADNEINTVKEIGDIAVFLLSESSSALNGANIVADRAMSTLLGMGDKREKRNG
ncbi:SDR family oxidoreductase [Marinomonas sp. TI.3.20]|uniref:SDR family NAD(P)-dependent oxidoreductase n=1 Tax=Marinomonas sp. TI.3.20 TaxID=3121296 RepID=UPI00311D820D